MGLDDFISLNYTYCNWPISSFSLISVADLWVQLLFKQICNLSLHEINPDKLPVCGKTKLVFMDACYTVYWSLKQHTLCVILVNVMYHKALICSNLHYVSEPLYSSHLFSQLCWWHSYKSFNHSEWWCTLNKRHQKVFSLNHINDKTEIMP